MMSKPGQVGVPNVSSSNSPATNSFPVRTEVGFDFYGLMMPRPTHLGVLKLKSLTPPNANLSVPVPAQGFNFASYSPVMPSPRPVGPNSAVPIPMQSHHLQDSFQNDSDCTAMSSSTLSSSNSNSRRRKQQISYMNHDGPEVQIISPRTGKPILWNIDTGKYGQSDERLGLEELAKKLCQRQEAMEIPSLLPPGHTISSTVLNSISQLQSVENGSFPGLAAAMETVQASTSKSLMKRAQPSTSATSMESVKPTPAKKVKKVKFCKSVIDKEIKKAYKRKVANPKEKPKNPKKPKVSKQKCEQKGEQKVPRAASKSKLKATSPANSAAATPKPKLKPSSTATSTSSSRQRRVFVAPEKVHISISDLANANRRHAVTLGRYDRRQHDMVINEEERMRCQYSGNYVCANRIATPDGNYCMEHFILASRIHGDSTSKSRKPVPMCAFIYKSSGAQIKCISPVCTLMDPTSKYCNIHNQDISAMKMKLLNLVEQNDYLDVLRYGCSVDLQNKPEIYSQSKPVSSSPDQTKPDNAGPTHKISEKVGQKTTGDNRQKKTENDEVISDESKANEPEVSSPAKPGPSAATNDPIMLVTQQRFSVPGAIELNKDEDDEGWMDYRSLTLKDIETLQLFQSDSDENSEDDEDIEGHEMLSTAGYHTTEELIRLLRDKLEALTVLYGQNRTISKEMYQMRRRHYLEEIEATKKTKNVRECSNPDMLPCNENFPAAYIANEQFDRNNVRYLLQQGSTKGQLGLLIHKAYEASPSAENTICKRGKSGHGSTISSSISSKEQKPCSSKSLGKPMNRGGKKAAVGSGKHIGKSMYVSEKSSPDKKSAKTKNSTKLQTEEKAELDVTKTNKCSLYYCTEKTVPLSKFCHKHIIKDEQQVMFIPCGSLKTTSTTCETPVMDLMETKGCPIHFQGWLPDLPLSKEEKEWLTSEEDKQMILPDAEEKVIDNILLSQFADLCHLEEELSAALKSDYLDTDSESEESTDDEKRLPPFPGVMSLSDQEIVEAEEIEDSDDVFSDDSDVVEAVESDDNEDNYTNE